MGTSGCEDWNHLSSIVFESMIQFCADTLRNPVLYQSLPSLLDRKGRSVGTRESLTLLYGLQLNQKHNLELRAHEWQSEIVFTIGKLGCLKGCAENDSVYAVDGRKWVDFFYCCILIVFGCCTAKFVVD